MLGATQPALAPALAVLLAIVAVPGGRSMEARPTDLPAAQDTLTATVRYVHAERGGIDVITGFHLALELTYIHVRESTRIETGGRSVSLEDLKPGDLIKVRYEETDEAKVAESIEVIRRREGGER